MKDTVLIGTFFRSNLVPRSKIRNIFDTFETSKIFVFEVKENLEHDDKQFLVTFNITRDEKERKLREYKEKYKNTIQLHRNKEFNTLYTINSLNKVVENQAGQKDLDFKVDWSNYSDSCVLLSDTGDVKVLPTRLFDIVELN